LIEEGIAAERRFREKLERNVALRTAELSDTNTRLSEEIRERQQTERRLNAMQVDLIQANKLAQLGQITAGVAHEINQPLATIRVLAENCISLMGQKIKGVPPLIEENLTNVVRMCERIGHITGELRAFSRKSTGESGPVPMKAALDASIMLNRSRLRDNRVQLILEPIDPKLQIVGRRVRLEQVVVILLQNAYEALESTTDPEVRITTTADHDWVWLRISDNGPGLNPEVMAQLFTPFVTTKEKGLGLGLVIAHDILRDFGGELTAENATSGAVFTLKLRKVAP
jgi:two-component system C4-dicarboxylate transport sensor histidine kinase DctB